MTASSVPRSIQPGFAAELSAGPLGQSIRQDRLEVRYRGDLVEVRGPGGLCLDVPAGHVNFDVQTPDLGTIVVQIDGFPCAGVSHFAVRLELRVDPGTREAEVARLEGIRDQVDDRLRARGESDGNRTAGLPGADTSGEAAAAGDMAAESGPRLRSPAPPRRKSPARPPFEPIKAPPLAPDSDDWIMLRPLADTVRLAAGELLVPEDQPTPPPLDSADQDGPEPGR